MSTEETKQAEDVPLEDVRTALFGIFSIPINHLPLKQMNNKTDETTPLTTQEATPDAGEENNVMSDKALEEKLSLEKDAEAAASEAGAKRKSLTARILGEEEVSLSNPRLRLLLSGLASVLLLLFLITVVIILLRSNNDTTYRYLRIIPQPCGKNNMISFRHGDADTSYARMVDEITEFLGPYRRAPDEAILCPNANKSDSHVCLFDINGVARECLKPDYGYPKGNPCIFIVFNNISDWVPKVNGSLAPIECRGKLIIAFHGDPI